MCSTYVYNFMLHLLIRIKLVHCYSIEKRTEARIKTFKNESDVGMLLTGLQSTETSCMYVGMLASGHFVNQ